MHCVFFADFIKHHEESKQRDVGEKQKRGGRGRAGVCTVQGEGAGAGMCVGMTESEKERTTL